MILILHCCNGKLIFDMNWNHLIEDDFNQIIHVPSFKFSSISSLLGDSGPSVDALFCCEVHF